MGFALNPILRGDLRALLWVCLAAFALGSCASKEVHALDSVGLEVAADELRVALDEMAAALNTAPREVQTTVSADLHLMSQAISRALGRLEDDAVPIIDPTLVYDLNFLTDIAETATRELRAAAEENGGVGAADRAERIGDLADAAAARLVEVNLVIDGWIERSRDAVVELAEVDGEQVVRTTDRLIYDGVRYTSIGLLLVGLLVVGMQLLRMSEDRVDSLALLRETPVLSGLGIIALTAFFIGCVVFSLRPGTLATLSAEVRQQPQEHPCERLAEQRHRLIAAQQVDNRMLIEATKQRMAPAARDCLGLPSETATAEALDLLAAKTAVAHGESPRPQSAKVAAAPAEPPESVSVADGTALPIPLDPTQTEELDALADLATQLRDAERALSERVDDAIAETLDQAEEGPAVGSEPAAGPATPAGPAAEPTTVTESSSDPSLPKPTSNLTAAPVPAVAPESAEPELYVTTTAVNYRAGPSLQARRLGTIVPGARLEVIGEDDGWSEIRLRDGRQVFVASEFLEQAP